VVVAFCWGRARTRGALVAWLLVPAIAVIVVLTPLSREWWWPTLLHPRLEAYIRPVGTFGVFSLFPAIAYVLVGAFLGALIGETDPNDEAFHRRVGLAGVVLILVGGAATRLPVPASITVPDSAPSFLWRIGAIILALMICRTILAWREPRSWSPLVVFGQTSLFVYWVHVELAYGVFSFPIRHTLTLPWSLVAYVVFAGFMLLCAVAWRGRARGPWIPVHMASEPATNLSFPGRGHPGRRDARSSV
jgi:hypothetical protein